MELSRRQQHRRASTCTIESDAQIDAVATSFDFFLHPNHYFP
jgi:hypothetical protein